MRSLINKHSIQIFKLPVSANLSKKQKASDEDQTDNQTEQSDQLNKRQKHERKFINKKNTLIINKILSILK